MSNEIVTQPQNEDDLIKALQASVYVDCTKEGIKLVISYCKMMAIDPLIKPVHLVKIDGKEVIFPAIALHRIRAHRSGMFLGMSEPIYDQEVTEMVGKTKMTYPKKCKVTIRKLVAGQIAEFTGNAVWKESYQTINDKVSPNVFWYKRPHSQLAKCAEADALKKAFPEIAGNVATFEEYNTAFNHEETPVASTVSHQNNAQIAVSKTSDEIKASITTTNVGFAVVDVNTGEVVNECADDEIKQDLLDDLKAYIKANNISAETLGQWKAKYAATSFSELTVEQLGELHNSLNMESK